MRVAVHGSSLKGFYKSQGNFGNIILCTKHVRKANPYRNATKEKKNIKKDEL